MIHGWCWQGHARMMIILLMLPRVLTMLSLYFDNPVHVGHDDHDDGDNHDHKDHDN